MKKLNAYAIKKWMLLLLGSFLIFSCEAYLDKSPDAVISSEDVFKKFVPLQGFMEDCYQCIIDVATRDGSGLSAWNWGDEVIGDSYRMDGTFTNSGDYMGKVYSTTSPFYGSASAPGTPMSTKNGTRQRKGYWDNGWYGIRKANMVIQNIDNCADCTEEQKNLLLGQAYFFRAYFHFEILRAWGGIPYVDKIFAPDDELKLPRLSYQKTAERISDDLKKAAGLLPVDWDLTVTGQPYTGQNTMRLTKGAAYAYLGKNLLYAASPLMNGVSTGNYSFDEKQAKEAAAAFWEVIKLANSGVYILEPWSKYGDNFYKIDKTMPHGKEIIFTNPKSGDCTNEWGSEMLNTHGGWGTYSSVCENYIEFFGMENGLPIFESGSGYNPSKPWDKRDPRFYYNILKHKDQLVINFTGSVPVADRYASLEVGGRHRSAGNSVTGYGYKKFHPIGWNKYDKAQTNQDPQLQCPKLRLADVYLMYAEAVNEAFGPTAVPSNISGGLSSVTAVNIVRTRANVPNVDNRFLTGKDKFRDIIWRERAVELAFENHRWYDLRRWYVAHEIKYREKFGMNFDANLTYFTKVPIVVKVFDMKHYWLPFKPEWAALYPSFQQNPGW